MLASAFGSTFQLFWLKQHKNWLYVNIFWDCNMLEVKPEMRKIKMWLHRIKNQDFPVITGFFFSPKET